MDVFTNSVKIKFAHISSILTHLESKCFINLESLIFFTLLALFFHIERQFSHLALNFFTFSSLFTYSDIFTFEGATNVTRNINIQRWILFECLIDNIYVNFGGCSCNLYESDFVHQQRASPINQKKSFNLIFRHIYMYIINSSLIILM